MYQVSQAIIQREYMQFNEHIYITQRGNNFLLILSYFSINTDSVLTPSESNIIWQTASVNRKMYRQAAGSDIHTRVKEHD